MSGFFQLLHLPPTIGTMTAPTSSPVVFPTSGDHTITMIDDEWQTWMYMGIAVVVVLWAVALFGCAAPDQPAPIARYRAAYGF